MGTGRDSPEQARDTGFLERVDYYLRCAVRKTQHVCLVLVCLMESPTMATFYVLLVRLLLFTGESDLEIVRIGEVDVTTRRELGREEVG